MSTIYKIIAILVLALLVFGWGNMQVVVFLIGLVVIFNESIAGQNIKIYNDYLTKHFNKIDTRISDIEKK